MKSPHSLSIAVLRAAIPALMAGSLHAALIAYEDFDYGGGANLTTETSNNGSGWTAAWATTGVNGLVTSGSGQSLYFDQSPSLTVDGSTHVFSESSRGNERDFTTTVDLATETFYFTALVRDYGGGAGVAQMRANFFDGAGATGNMRANIGIDGGTLFVDGNTAGYGVGDTQAGAFVTNTTYLLAMKRTGSSIFGALIPADGNSATLAAEPVWQVQDNVASGVDLTSIRLLTNSTDPDNGAGIRIDELRLATDWDSAVNGLVIPEPSSAALLGFGGLLLAARRRRHAA
ncbi:MAG: PEP-CTERM sorting domain-containing protein [Haloferula sp.]